MSDSANLLENDSSPFNRLVGKWKNIEFNSEDSKIGGEEQPMSYNVMPLPQKDGNDVGFILKNFRYYETLEVNDKDDVAAPAVAPNRAGSYQQNVIAWFYSQQVRFAEGPAKGKVIHEENGAWLHLQTGVQNKGPYDMGEVIEPRDKVPQQSADSTVAKQMSVPHGNIILSLGKFGQIIQGVPQIPDASALPTRITDGYTPERFKAIYSDVRADMVDFQNPNPDFTLNPNAPIQRAVELINPKYYIKWHVNTDDLPHDQSSILNIPFAKQSADIVKYDATYWLLSRDGENFDQLLYSQNIGMVINIDGDLYNFPHITCNALSRYEKGFIQRGCDYLEGLGGK